MHTFSMVSRLSCFAVAISFLFTGCNPNAPTFPQELLKEHIREICLNDYGIEDVDVKISGKTLGVHLPLKKLFTNDIQALMASGKIKNVESLLALSPEAIEKIQDVMFTTSRVLFSSDSNIDFYVLKATDYEGTGIEFILVNYLEDVKRVRFWDIPLSEYYKRSYRDMKMNQSIFLKKPVLDLFDNVGSMKLPEVFKRYFTSKTTLKDISPFFYTILLEYAFKKDLKIKVLNSKARAFRPDEVLVYAKIEETYEPTPAAKKHKFIYPSGTILEYIFILKPAKEGLKIDRVLPFNYVDPDGVIKKIDFPESLSLYQNIDAWSEDFEVEEIVMGNFLAEQVARRTGMKLYEDEELATAFEKMEPTVVYSVVPLSPSGIEGDREEREPLAFFKVDLELKPRKLTLLPSDPEFMNDPMVQKAVETALRKIRKVLYGYDFKDYQYVDFQVVGMPESYRLRPDQLEKFRKNKVDLAKILTPQT
jgi:hypothetical protein